MGRHAGDPPRPGRRSRGRRPRRRGRQGRQQGGGAHEGGSDRRQDHGEPRGRRAHAAAGGAGGQGDQGAVEVGGGGQARRRGEEVHRAGDGAAEEGARRDLLMATMPHYDRDRALAEALDKAMGHGAGEAGVTVTTPGLGEGYTGGEMIASLRLPDWAARTFLIQLGPARPSGVPVIPGATVANWLGFPGIPDLGAGVLPVIARVTWGIGGASFQADVSWQDGSSFAVSGSYGERRAVACANPPWMALPAGATVHVSGAIIPADAVHKQSSQPMLQSAPVTIANNTTQVWQVPPF